MQTDSHTIIHLPVTYALPLQVPTLVFTPTCRHVTAQEVRIASTYGRQPSSKSRATTATKRPTTSKVLTYRPTYLHTIPSAAAVSFNFALGNYTPARIEDVKKYSRAMHSHVLI